MDPAYYWIKSANWSVIGYDLEYNWYSIISAADISDKIITRSEGSIKDDIFFLYSIFD